MSNNSQTTILIIDDDPTVRQSLGFFLEDQNYLTIQAENGRIGLEIFDQEKVDLVLVDLRMPEVDGLEVLARIRKMSPDTPMIVVSGAGEIGSAVEALHKGAWDYLLKPIKNFSLLMHAVTSALEKARLIQENLEYQQHLERMVAKQTEEIREREEQYRSILDTATDAIISIDEKERIYIWNKSAEKIFGYTKNEVIGATVHPLLVPKAYLTDTEVGLKHFFETGKGPILGKTTELTALYKNGDEFPIELSLSSFKIAGKWHATSIIRDITTRRITEDKIKKALKEKDVLLREVNHRVKNNLNVIISLLNLKADAIHSGKSAIEAFEESRNLVYSMAMVHDELYQSSNLSAINIKDYIENLAIKLIEIYQPFVEIEYKLQIANVNIDINKAIPCGLILTELITNALKHAYNDIEEKGVLKITCIKSETGDCRISIKDNGSGLPGDIDIQKPESTGLQLVSILADQINGRMSVNTDNGTEIIIRFPE